MKKLIVCSIAAVALALGGGFAFAATTNAQSTPLPAGCQYGVPSSPIHGQWYCGYYEGQLVCCQV